MASDTQSIPKGKGSETLNSGFKPQGNMVAVVPPKPEDLQRSYATVVDANANPKGWYGSMGVYLMIQQHKLRELHRS